MYTSDRCLPILTAKVRNVCVLGMPAGRFQPILTKEQAGLSNTKFPPSCRLVHYQHESLKKTLGKTAALQYMYAQRRFSSVTPK